MSSKATHDSIDPVGAGSLSYWECSKRPLEILVFLAPLILVYEICLLGVLRMGSDVVTNAAHKSIATLFEVLGIPIAGIALPGIVLVVVLLAWQFLLRAPWRFQWSTIGLMWLESLLWAAPLLLAAQLLSGMSVLALETGESGGLVAHLAIAIGAGLYEELVFRWVLISIVHMIACDIFKARHGVGLGIGIVVSAVAFARYHPIAGGPWGQLAFFLIAGLFFSVIFVTRGFGIVAATHALYDVAVFLLDAQTA
jgi:membrane protease YdiL (CAAX protease family)